MSTNGKYMAFQYGDENAQLQYWKWDPDTVLIYNKIIYNNYIDDFFNLCKYSNKESYIPSWG